MRNEQSEHHKREQVKAHPAVCQGSGQVCQTQGNLGTVDAQSHGAACQLLLTEDQHITARKIPYG